MHRSIPLFCILLLACTTARAQNQIGLDRSSQRYYTFDTPTGRFIYTEGLDSVAFRAADIMRYQQQNASSLLGELTTRKVPVIIRSGSVMPAGFSTPGPWRNEYYTTPPYNPFLGPVPWMDALTAHEYRHTQQFQAARSGWTALYRVLMGETGWLFNTLITQPLWFREGDAVLSETLLSDGGRGRLPAFHMEYRALRVEGRRFDYEKAHFGSFRDYVPNPYRLGYYMVTKARRDHGELLWSQVMEDTYRKGFFWPFSRAMQGGTGSGTKAFYRSTMTELDNYWIPLDAGRKTPGATAVEAETPRMFTSYRYPHFGSDGRIVALASGFDRIASYVAFNDGHPQELFKPGVYTDDHARLVVEGDRMVWAESAFHERWLAVDYSVVKVHDRSTGRTRKLAGRTRWFSPAIAPDGSTVVVGETDLNNRHRVLLIDGESGAVRKELQPPSDVQRTHFRYTRDGSAILALLISARGNAIARIDVASGEEQIVVAYTHVPMYTPVDDGRHIYFSAGVEGTQNIHALDPTDGAIYRVTNERFGAFDPMPSPDGDRLLYTSYTADGHRLMMVPKDPAQWQRTELGQPFDHFHQSAAAFEGNADPAQAISGKYTPVRFRPLTSGLLRLYGWFPVPNPPVYGLEIYTQNVMSTIRGTIGVAYNTSEESMNYSGRLTYAGLYPLIETEWTYGGRRISTIALNDSSTQRTQYTENMVSGGLSFPFRLTQGIHNTDVIVGGRLEYFDVTRTDTLDAGTVQVRENFPAWRATIAFARLQPQARRHVRPRWGQQLAAEWRSSFDEAVLRQFISGTLYFPGLMRTHSFNLAGTWRKENVIGTYRFVDDRLMPNGLMPQPFEEIASGTANYELPLFHPDLAAGPVAILQRVRVNLFAGHAQTRITTTQQDYTFTGAELMLDMRFLRLFQTTVLLRGTLGQGDGLQPDAPFQFLVTRFEFAN